MSTSYPLRLFFLVFLLLPLSAAASIPPIPAQAPGYVVDLAAVLGEQDKQQLDGLLRNLEQQTSAQMVILTVDSLDGEDIHSFSLQTAEQWKVGQKGKDNGLLLVVALQDRKYRFEVGYGLEAFLPDSLVGSIGRKILVPQFKQGHYSGGIIAATGEILKVLSTRYGVTISGADQLPVMSPQQNNRFSVLIFFLFVLIFILFVYSRSVNKKMKKKGGLGSGGPGMGPVIFPGGGWDGGSSGGFGGFSGGGGSFGGGGASGGW